VRWLLREVAKRLTRRNRGVDTGVHVTIWLT
jgi:hypothetical protein